MPFNTEDVILFRRCNVAKRHLEGWTQHRIAIEEGVDRSQISLDLKWLRDQWLEEGKSAFAEKKANELAKLDNMEAELWEEWHKSKKPQKRKSSKMKGAVIPDPEQPGKTKQMPHELETSEWSEEKGADPQYMALILRCVETRIKTLGLSAPDKLEITEKNLPGWLKAVNPLKASSN